MELISHMLVKGQNNRRNLKNRDRKHKELNNRNKLIIPQKMLLLHCKKQGQFNNVT